MTYESLFLDFAISWMNIIDVITPVQSVAQIFNRSLLLIYPTFVIVYVPMWKIFDSQLLRVSLIVTYCEI